MKRLGWIILLALVGAALSLLAYVQLQSMQLDRAQQETDSQRLRAVEAFVAQRGDWTPEQNRELLCLLVKAHQLTHPACP